MKLELYYFDECPYCQIVLNKIKNLGIQNKIIMKNTRHDPQAKNFHVNKTGRTTVPCLYIDDEPMFESRDIAEWLSQNIKNF
jgi:glutaredoxin